MNPAALEKNAFANTSAAGASLGNTYRYGIVPNNDSKNKLENTSMDACCRLRLDFSPYEFRKNPVTSNRTVVRYIPVAATVSSNNVATIAGTSSRTPANCNTNPRFPNTAFTGGLSNRGATAVASLITFAMLD